MFLFKKSSARLRKTTFKLRLATLTVAFFIAFGGSFFIQHSNNQIANADAINATDFVTTWRISDPGSTSITIQTSGGGYNYNVDWNNDGEIDEAGLTGNVTHDFGGVGDYTIRISGTFPRIYNYFNSSNSMKLVDINQWGTIQWNSMSYAFSNTGLTTLSAIDTPDLSNVTNMSNMFSYTPTFNSDLSHWDTSYVTNMSSMFYQAAAFNGDISSWDTSNVTTMNSMFYQAAAFNQDISGWNTEKVTNMSYMFSQTSAFNQNLSGWATAKVTSMSGMFDRATAFDGDISLWNTASVTDMSNMFGGASAFNQNISGWATSNVINMSNMFSSAATFNQNLSGWNTAKVTNMSYMFNGASAFNQDVSSWNTAAVTNMQGMFSWATSFNLNLTTWNTANVTDMSWMFQKASTFNGNITTWNTTKVTNMLGMFSEAPVFNQNIAGWDTSKVTSMANLFYEAHDFNQNLATWNVTSVTDMYGIFYGSYNTPGPLSSANYDATLVGWASQIGLQNNVSLGSGLPAYCSPEGKVARQSLITNHSWTFSSNNECDLPLAPTDLLATPTAYSSTLSWIIPGNTYRSLTDYQIEYSSDNGESWNIYPHTPSTATAIVLEGLSANTNYRFRVAGVNARGVGTASSYASATTLTALPDAPQNLELTPSAHSVALSWDIPLRDGGLSITDYNIEYSIDGGDSWQVISRDAAVVTNYEAIGLTPVTDYSFRVAAVNNLGAGEFSQAAATRTLPTTPSAPTNLDAIPAVESVTLSWQAPEQNGGENITDYLIEYSSNNGSSWQPVARDASTDLHAIVVNLYRSTPYQFRVAAKNSIGTSAFSDAIEATPTITPTSIGVHGLGDLEEPSSPPILPKRPTFSGTTTPLSSVTVTVHSDPITCSTIATNQGDWTCTLPEDLAAGNHEVFVLVTLPDSTTREYGPYDVIVEADATPPPVVIAPQKINETVERDKRNYYVLYSDNNIVDSNYKDKMIDDDAAPLEQDETLHQDKNHTVTPNADKSSENTTLVIFASTALVVLTALSAVIWKLRTKKIVSQLQTCV